MNDRKATSHRKQAVKNSCMDAVAHSLAVHCRDPFGAVLATGAKQCMSHLAALCHVKRAAEASEAVLLDQKPRIWEIVRCMGVVVSAVRRPPSIWPDKKAGAFLKEQEPNLGSYLAHNGCGFDCSCASCSVPARFRTKSSALCQCDEGVKRFDVPSSAPWRTGTLKMSMQIFSHSLKMPPGTR
jgi:hypothetical protein